MQFLDLNTGYTFDALWHDKQINGYTFWFPNEQSIRLTYTMPICIYMDISSPIELEMEENPIFSFIKHDIQDTEHGGFTFKEPIYSYKTTTDVEKISVTGASYHKFYIACKSENAGEFTTFINIKGYGRIKIGADFYGEYEPVYINLSNMGVEIPEYVQKAIYDSNVHEDYKDDILINRKFKELLSNYWDLIANRGSYKSLINTLSWFEWGDILRIREIWKRNVAGKVIYDDRELCSLLENKYEDSLGNFIKTTYFSLYANLYKTTDNYDEEENPELEAIAIKWGKEDLALKLSLLAQFFATFFMPIHTSLLHSCVEDVVYTNTIKAIEGSILNRTDTFCDWNYISSNVDYNNEFKISNIRAQVTENTVFKTNYNETDVTIGVDEFPTSGKLDETSIYNFAGQYYTGPGAIIPIEMTLYNQTPRDYIKYTSIDFIPDGKIIEKNILLDENNILKFNGFINELLPISNNHMDILSVNDIYFNTVTNKFIGSKIPESNNFNLVIKGSMHGSYYIENNINPNIEWDKYNYAFSDIYGFIRYKDRKLFVNAPIDDKYKKNTVQYYKYTVSGKIYKWNNSMTDIIETELYPIYSYNFKLSEYVNYDIYTLNTKTFIDINTDKPYIWANNTLIEKPAEIIYKSKPREKFIFKDRFYTRNNTITVKFNLLVKEAREYVLDFMFITASSKTLTKKIKLNITDADNLNIKLYKVQAKDDSKGFTYNDWNNMEYNDYFFRIQHNDPNAKQYYSQYLPYMSQNNKLYTSHKGIKLNRTIVIDMLNKNGHGKIYDDNDIAKLKGFMDNDFLEFDKRELLLDKDGNPQLDNNGNRLYGPVTYTIWVSKRFNAELPEQIITDKYNIIRNSLSFYPQFHKLTAMDSLNIEDYTINQYEAVCCAAEINNNSRKEAIPFRYGHLIEESEWSFENATTLEKFDHTLSVRQPFIAHNKSEELPDGYYDVVFRYKLTDSEPRELRLKSAFRKKSI